MDFNSWQPEDTARRFTLFIANCVGVFAFIALWLGLALHMLLAILGGAAIGFVVFKILYPLVLAYYKR